MKYRKLLESMEKKYQKDMRTRRYNLSEIISESYKVLYTCEQGSNLHKVVESHLTDVRKNPTDMERLSRQLSTLKHIVTMVESKKMNDEELLVPEENYTPVEPEEEKVEESVQEDVAEEDDENLLEDTDLTDEEVEELAKHLSDIRKNKKVVESKGRKLMKRVREEQKAYTPTKEEVSQIIDYIKEKFGASIGEQDYIDVISKFCPQDEVSTDIVDYSAEKAGIKVGESKEWSDIKEGLKNFSKESSSKAFYKTFKKMSGKLQEGTALTRQESISLYKAANSAMTHLSVELEHNPEFLDTFRESVSLLSEDVAKVLGSLKNNKAPSKATMKSLAKFAEALLIEAEDEDGEELPPIEDEEIVEPEEEEAPAEEEAGEEETPSEVDEFDQEYADARVELHKEMVDDHAEDEDPEIQERIAQDAEEIMSLPGVTDEQIAEITGEEIPAEVEADEPEEEEAPAEEELEETDDEEITDDELAELKKHLMEMRAMKKSQ